MTIEVRPGTDRFVTRAEGRTTWHSFSFGRHYDPHNTGFGAMVAHNDEHLPAGSGYADHPHHDLEIVTFVLRGQVEHRDSLGGHEVLNAGDVQYLSAGSGLTHSEHATTDARFVQVWVRPDESDLVPTLARAHTDAAQDGLVLLASGDVDAPVSLRARGASLHAGLLSGDAPLALPQSPRVHVFVASGAVVVGDRRLDAGGAARLIDQGGRQLTATAPDTQLLVWSLP